MPGLIIDKVGNGASLDKHYGSPVLNLVELAAIDSRNRYDKQRRYVDAEGCDYYFKNGAVEGDIAPDDQNDGKGFWIRDEKSKGSVTTVNTIQDLRNIEDPEENQSVEVLGYYAPGDGGGGIYYWDFTSNETPNAGTIVHAEGVAIGRWKLATTEITPYLFGLKGKEQEENLTYAQYFIDYCAERRITALFKNDKFRLGDIIVRDNLTIKTENATILPAANMISTSIFSGVANNLRFHVKGDLDNSTMLLFINSLGTIVSNLDIDCEINDTIPAGGRTRHGIYLVCSLEDPVISVKATSVGGNNVAVIQNAHAEFSNYNIDLKHIEIYGWGSGWIHDGVGYSEGVNHLRYFYAENAKGKLAGDGDPSIISTYHMRKLQVGKVFTIDCDRRAFLWTPESFELLYTSGYTGLNDTDLLCGIYITSCQGGGGNIVALDSQHDGVLVFGGYLQVTELLGERCNGRPLVAKSREAGSIDLDVTIENMRTRDNGKGSFYVYNTEATPRGVKYIRIKGGFSIGNNKVEAGADIKIISGVDGNINISGFSSQGSDCAIEINGTGGYNNASVTNCPYLHSTGTNTVLITGTNGYGRRIIRESNVDSVSKLKIEGAGIAVIEDNFDWTLGKVLPEKVNSHGVVADLDRTDLLPGLHKVSSSITLNNPTTSSGALIVEPSGANGYITQKLQPISIIGEVKMLIRHFENNGNGWTKWVALFHSGNLLESPHTWKDVQTHSEPPVVPLATEPNHAVPKKQVKSIAPPVENPPYADASAMYLDQAKQTKGYAQYVTNVGYFEYLGTTNGDATDYRVWGSAAPAGGTIDVAASRNLTADDNGKTLLCTGDIILTMVAGLGKDFTCNFINVAPATGVVRIVGGAGFTLNAPHGNKLLVDYPANLIKKTNAEVGYLQGELTP